MNKVLKTAGFLLLCILFSAKSCDDSRSMEEQNQDSILAAAKDSIRQVTEAPGLSEDALEAAGSAALQKLSDYRDYSDIMADTILDPSFRQKAGEMAAGLFRSGRLPSHAIKIDSARAGLPFHEVSDTAYEGTLQIFRNSPVRGPGSLEVFILKKPKVFGTDTLYNWEVLLGDFN